MNPLAAQEPSNALKTALYLRTDPDLAESFRADLDQIAATVQEKRKVHADDWLDVYGDLVARLVALQNEQDRRLADLQARSPSSDEISRVTSTAAEPRREADQVRSRVKAALKRASDDWKDRVRRQAETNVLEPIVAQGRSTVTIHGRPGGEGLVLEVDAPWVDSFTAYVASCCQTWGAQALEGAERSFAEAVAETSRGRKGALPAPAAPAPDVEPRLDVPPPADDVEVPGRVALVVRSLRGDLTTVVFLGGVLATVSGVVFTSTGVAGLFGAIAAGQDPAIQKPTWISMVLVVIALPLSLLAGISAASRQRRRLVAKGTSGHRTKVDAWVGEGVRRALDRHRQKLQRWVQLRAEDWERAVDQWWDDRVVPELREREGAAERRSAELRASQAQLAAEAAQVRTFRQKVATALGDVRRRQQDLLDEARSGG